MITFDQIRGPVERVLYIAGAWAVGKGLIADVEVAGYVALALGIFGALYGWWQNRPKAIMQSAAAIPHTVVVTSQDLSDATPSNANILSVDDSQLSVTNAVKVAKGE